MEPPKEASSPFGGCPLDVPEANDPDPGSDGNQAVRADYCDRALDPVQEGSFFPGFSDPLHDQPK
jgi:hypothetical protein